MGATLAEYNNAKVHSDVWVVSVTHHKTATQGPARLTLEQCDKHRSMLTQCAHKWTPQEHLLLLPGNVPIKKVSPLLKTLSVKFGVAIPTSTDVRKSVATQAAASCSSSEVRVLSKFMSYTHRKSLTLLREQPWLIGLSKAYPLLKRRGNMQMKLLRVVRGTQRMKMKPSTS